MHFIIFLIYFCPFNITPAVRMAIHLAHFVNR